MLPCAWWVGTFEYAFDADEVLQVVLHTPARTIGGKFPLLVGQRLAHRRNRREALVESGDGVVGNGHVVSLMRVSGRDFAPNATCVPRDTG